MLKWSLPLVALSLAIFVAVPAAPLRAAPADDVTAAFNAFVRVQNAHDSNALKDLLWDSQAFLWITRGTPIVGRDAALARFSALYGGTWSLAPVSSELRVTMLAPTVACVYVPIDFTIGAAGQPATVTRFLMNQTLLKTDRGWVVASILPIPAAPSPTPAPKV